MAAFARDEDGSTCIVTCSDKMESADAYGSEILHKLQVLSPDLVSLFADSPSRAHELALLYQDYLQEHPLKPSLIVEQLERPLVALKRRLAESYVGRRLGISYDDLLKDKANWGDYLDRIEKHQLRVQLIIAGFIGTRPIMLETAQVDTSDDHDRLEWVTHFASIGSGTWVAKPTLYMREQDRNAPLTKTLYQLYEAKRQAEISPTVGKLVTRMFVIRPHRAGPHLDVDVVTDDGMNALEALYRQYGPKPLPLLPEFKPSTFQKAHFLDPEGRRDR